MFLTASRDAQHAPFRLLLEQCRSDAQAAGVPYTYSALGSYPLGTAVSQRRPSHALRKYARSCRSSLRAASLCALAADRRLHLLHTTPYIRAWLRSSTLRLLMASLSPLSFNQINGCFHPRPARALLLGASTTRVGHRCSRSFATTWFPSGRGKHGSSSRQRASNVLIHPKGTQTATPRTYGGLIGSLVTRP